MSNFRRKGRAPQGPSQNARLRSSCAMPVPWSSIGDGIGATILNGLTGGIAEVGDHASITADLAGIPAVSWSSQAWGTSYGDATYGTGSSPADYSDSDSDTLYFEGVGNNAVTYRASAPVRYAAPVNTVAPSISSAGTSVGDTQTANTGTWTGATGGAFTYQWRRNGGAISGATGGTYDLTVNDDAATITVDVTYTNSGGSQTVSSSNSVAVDDFSAPSIPGVPTISGTETEGQTLTATASTPVSGLPTPTRTWQWKRNGSNISGATAATLTLSAADVGATISVTQTETNAIGAQSSTSASTGTIAASSGDTTPPLIDSLAFDDPNNEFDVEGTETESLPLKLHWAAADPGANPTCVAGGTWSGTRYEDGTITGLAAGASSHAMVTATTPYGARELTIYLEDNAGNISLVSRQAFTHSAVPDAFVDADWSVATGTGAKELDVTIATLPTDNGDPILDVEYDIDGSGTWASLPGYAGTGTYPITMAAGSTSYAIRLRAVNDEGNAPAGNSESATSAAGSSIFADDDFDGDSKTTYTFTMDLPNAPIALLIGAGANADRPVSSVTIDGVSATLRQKGSFGNSKQWHVWDTNGTSVTGGTARTVTVVFSTAPFRCMAAAYDVTGKTYQTHAQQTATTTTPAVNVATTAGDTVIGGLIYSNASNQNAAVTGGFASLDRDALIDSASHWGAVGHTDNAAGGSPESFGFSIDSSLAINALSAVYS